MQLIDSLPMFTALRRFSIWMTMIGEQFILKYLLTFLWFLFHITFVNEILLFREQQSFTAQTSVYLMIIGALIASGDDLTFNWFGYIFLSINNIFTTAQGVVIKQKLVNKVREFLRSNESNFLKRTSNI